MRKKNSTIRIYMDVCALCRPYDAQDSLRICVETSSVHLILDHVRQGRFTLVASPAHYIEVHRTSDREEETGVIGLLTQYGEEPRWRWDEVRQRAEELQGLGIGVADAAHVAFAEAEAHVFLTCDDSLIRKCRRHSVNIKCMNPMEFVLEHRIE